MEQQDYQISITVNADAKKAFENICDVKDWWTKNTEGGTNKMNNVFTVRFGETFVTFKIIEFTANKKITWLVTDSNVQGLKDTKEWNDTTVDWQLAEDNAATKITMTHVGLVPDVECYDMCIKGWDFYTGKSLLQLINEGEGLPDTPQAKR